MVIAGAYWIKSSNTDFKTHDDALMSEKPTLTKNKLNRISIKSLPHLYTRQRGAYTGDKKTK
jgi:hypothetical protein